MVEVCVFVVGEEEEEEEGVGWGGGGGGDEGEESGGVEGCVGEVVGYD